MMDREPREITLHLDALIEGAQLFEGPSEEELRLLRQAGLLLAVITGTESGHELTSETVANIDDRAFFLAYDIATGGSTSPQARMLTEQLVEDAFDRLADLLSGLPAAIDESLEGEFV